MIRDDIKAATITAMKSGDKETTGTLRLVQAAIKNRDIEARTGSAPKPLPQIVRPSANTTTPVAPSGWGAGAGRASAMGVKSLPFGFSTMSLRHCRYAHSRRRSTLVSVKMQR